ncbi:hypothetical protein Tco_1281965 [Tanacetum coccineum]
MAQPQQQGDVHQDRLCPPNKHFALMDANKKFDLENPLCLNECKILANILQNHTLRFSIAASTSVPWIYLSQFWHTLKEDGSKYRFKFVLDTKELTMTLDDFRRIFQLPQATDDNHVGFVVAPTFSKMFSFFTDDLDPITPIPTAAEVDVTNLHETIQMSIATQRILEDFKAQQNVAKVKEHIVEEEIEQLIEGTENMHKDEFLDDNLNSQEDPGTRIGPRSHKESLKAKIDADFVFKNVYEEEEESTRDDYELKRRKKRKNIEETRDTPSPKPIRSLRTLLLHLWIRRNSRN